MTLASLSAAILTKRLAGRQVSRVSLPEGGRLTIHFEDGGALFNASGPSGLRTMLQASHPRSASKALPSTPTQRQLDYLRFISRYVVRFGRSPAESDIQRHFLVAAPSVNHMVRTLERRGFISRTPGVPRSIVVRFVLPPEPYSTR